MLAGTSTLYTSLTGSSVILGRCNACCGHLKMHGSVRTMNPSVFYYLLLLLLILVISFHYNIYIFLIIA